MKHILKHIEEFKKKLTPGQFKELEFDKGFNDALYGDKVYERYCKDNVSTRMFILGIFSDVMRYIDNMRNLYGDFAYFYYIDDCKASEAIGEVAGFNARAKQYLIRIKTLVNKFDALDDIIAKVDGVLADILQNPVDKYAATKAIKALIYNVAIVADEFETRYTTNDCRIADEQGVKLFEE